MLEEWKIFLTIGEILALFFLIGKPILKLSGILSQILVEIRQVKEQQNTQRNDMNTMRQEAKASHAELWRHESEQDNKLNDHEKRIFAIEHKK